MTVADALPPVLLPCLSEHTLLVVAAPDGERITMYYGGHKAVVELDHQPPTVMLLTRSGKLLAWDEVASRSGALRFGLQLLHSVARPQSPG